MSTITKKRSQIVLVTLLTIAIFGWFLFGLTNTNAAVKLVNTNPTTGQYLDYNSQPLQIRLQFDDKVKLEGSSITVAKEGSIETTTLNPTLALDPADPKAVFATLGARSALGANRYTVNYSVIAEADNQPTNGNYSFYILPEAKNPLSFDYIFSTPTDAFTNNWRGYNYPPLATAFFFVVLIGALLSNFVFFYGKYFFRSNRLTYTVVNRASRGVAIVTSVGLVFFLCRIANLQPLNARFFLYATLILAIIFLFRGVGFMLRGLPKARTEWRELQSKTRRKEERELEVQQRREERRPPERKTVVPTATTTTSVSNTSGSVDAGGEEADSSETTAIPAARPLDGQRGISTRGEKRRAKKRERR